MIGTQYRHNVHLPNTSQAEFAEHISVLANTDRGTSTPVFISRNASCVKCIQEAGYYVVIDI